MIVWSVLVSCASLREPSPLTPTPATVQVTADQIAQAMQEDHFFSDYEGDILQVQGTVANVAAEAGGTVVELQTGIPTKVRCHVDGSISTLQPGAAITVESSQGQRENGAVGLLHCRVIAP